MDRVKPEYDRMDVNSAGRKIAAGQGDDGAYSVFNNWRACHGYPLNTFQANLRGKIKRLKINNTIVSQRIKREESIVEKLKRSPDMKLSQMQDIGGLRAVVSTAGEVSKLMDQFRNDRAAHKLAKINDYINAPKDSGYRSTHLVFKYINKKVPQYDDLKIEIQLRTRLQHYWANAVETVGTYLKHSLKASQGPDEWLDFFSICGEIFARKEKTTSHVKYLYCSNDEMLKLCRKKMDELNAVSILDSFSAVTKYLTGKDGNSKGESAKSKTTHLVYLDTINQEVVVSSFSRKDSERANIEYAEIEKRIREGEKAQVVLVSIDSVNALKRAYPSYFLDAQGFLRELRNIRNAAMAKDKYFPWEK